MAKRESLPEEIHKKLLTLPRSLHDEIAAIAKQNERSIEAEIRVALRNHVAARKAAA